MRTTRKAINLFFVALLIFFLASPVESQSTKNKRTRKSKVKISVYDLYSTYKDAVAKQRKKEAKYIVQKIIEEIKAQNDLNKSSLELQKILLKASLADMVEYKLGYFNPDDEVYKVRLSIAHLLFESIKRHKKKIDSVRSPMMSTSTLDYSSFALSGLKSTSDPKLRKYLVLSEFLKRIKILEKFNIRYDYKGRDFELIANSLPPRKKQQQNKQR